jgi:hypothetical protein
MLAQLLIRDDSVELLILSLKRVALAVKHESHLLLGHLISAGIHDLLDQIH